MNKGDAIVSAIIVALLFFSLVLLYIRSEAQQLDDRVDRRKALQEKFKGFRILYGSER